VFYVDGEVLGGGVIGINQPQDAAPIQDTVKTFVAN
jgi:hypothetical protein